MDELLKEIRLFHINWGDGDDTFVFAETKEDAINKMPDGKDMVNYVVELKGVVSYILSKVQSYYASLVEEKELLTEEEREKCYASMPPDTNEEADWILLKAQVIKSRAIREAKEKVG